MSAELPVYRRRRPGQWVLTFVVVLLAASLLQSLITNRRFGWDTVGAWLFSRTVMTGLLTTMELTAAAMGRPYMVAQSCHRQVRVLSS